MHFVRRRLSVDCASRVGDQQSTATKGKYRQRGEAATNRTTDNAPEAQ
jgi:hypothetical protein